MNRRELNKIGKKLGINTFCPTGEGGGIDPSCPSGKGGKESKTDISLGSESLSHYIKTMLTDADGGGYEDEAERESDFKALLKVGMAAAAKESTPKAKAKAAMIAVDKAYDVYDEANDYDPDL